MLMWSSLNILWSSLEIWFRAVTLKFYVTMLNFYVWKITQRAVCRQLVRGHVTCYANGQRRYLDTTVDV